MSKWTNLYFRYGACVHRPTRAQLMAAIQEVFASTDEEHPHAWIECGSDGGLLYTLSIAFDGTSTFVKYSDVDMTDELETSTRTGLDADHAIQAWENLIAAEGR